MALLFHETHSCYDFHLVEISDPLRCDLARHKSKMKVLIVIMLVFVLTDADSGFVKIKNHGLYVAKVRLWYTTSDGKQVYKVTDPFWLWDKRTLEIPDGATDISVEAVEFWFIGMERNIFKTTLPKPDNYCYKLHGFTFAPSKEQYHLFCVHVSIGSDGDDSVNTN